MKIPKATRSANYPNTYDQRGRTRDVVLTESPKPVTNLSAYRAQVGISDPFALVPEYPAATAADMDDFALGLDDVYNIASVEIYGVSITMPKGHLSFGCAVDPRWLEQLLQIARHRGERLFMTIHAVKPLDEDDDVDEG